MKPRNTLALLFAVLMFPACGGKSAATGDVVPMEKVCAYEKWKTVAVEGYLAPLSMACEKATRKRTSGFAWCSFKVYADEKLRALTSRYKSRPRMR